MRSMMVLNGETGFSRPKRPAMALQTRNISRSWDFEATERTSAYPLKEANNRLSDHRPEAQLQYHRANPALPCALAGG